MGQRPCCILWRNGTKRMHERGKRGHPRNEVKPMEPHPKPEITYPVPMTAENIQRIFGNSGDLNQRTIWVGPKAQPVWIFSIDGLVSDSSVSDFVIKPMLEAGAPASMELVQQVICNAVAIPLENMDDAAAKLVNGFCVVLFAPEQGAAFEVKTGEKRSISSPEVENTIKGAKDAFTETVRTNTSLLRRHLRTPDLRLREYIVGRRSLTNITVCYIDGLTAPELVEAVEQRIASVDVDGILSPAAVEEYLTGSRKTAFPLQIYTERPDRFAWGMLEGRVGILVDGLPLGYLLPCDLEDFLTSPEDRNGNYVVASCIKFLRYVSLVGALLLPGCFGAVSLYHQEMIPVGWLRAIGESRTSVPFSTGVEVLLLLIAFELLQEAGLHLPQNLGQAVSVIGGLVVGSAAVEAGLISPAALIVVAAAGICGYTLPQRDFADGLRVWRFAIAVAGLVAGLSGVTMMGILLLIHWGDLYSLGWPYLGELGQGHLPSLRKRLVQEKLREQRMRPMDVRNQR